MHTGRVWRWLRIPIAIILVGVLGICLLLLLQPRVPVDALVDRFAARIEASTGLGIGATDASITFSLRPKVSAGSVRVDMPDGRGTLHVESLVAHLELLSIRAGMVRVPRAHAESLQIQLAKRENLPESSSDRPPPSPPSVPRLDLPRITVNTVALTVPGVQTLTVARAELLAPAGTGLRLTCATTWQEQKIAFRVEGGALQDLVTRADAWPVTVAATSSSLGRADLQTTLEPTGSRSPVTNRLAVALMPSQVPGLVENTPFVSDLQGLQGTASWTGWAPETIWSSLVLRGRVEDLRMAWGGIPIGFPSVDLSRDPSTGIEIQAGATLADVPIALDVHTDPFPAWPPTAPVPIQGTARGSGAELAWNMTWDPAAPETGHRIHLRLSGDSLGESAALTGLSPNLSLPYRATGHLDVNAAEWTLELADLAVGETRGRGSVASRRNAPENMLRADVHLAQLALEEWDSAKLPSPPPTPNATATPTFVLDMPILPQHQVLPNIRADLHIDRITGTRSELQNARIELVASEGWLQDAPFRLQVGKMAWSGRGELDLRGDIPSIRLRAETHPLRLEDLLDPDRFDTGLLIHAAGAAFTMEATGSRLRELLASVHLTVSAHDLVVREPGKPDDPLRLNQVEIEQVGDRLTATGAMSLAGLPVRIHLEARSPGQEQPGPRAIPVRAEFHSPNLDARLDGTVLRTGHGLSVDARVNLESGDPEELLAGLRVPLRVGSPISGSFQLALGEPGLTLTDIQATMGGTRMKGDLLVDFNPDAPRLIADLDLPRLALNEWAWVASDDEASGVELELELDVTMDEVVTSTQSLGPAEARLVLKPGEIDLQHLRVSADQGTAELSFSRTTFPHHIQQTLQATTSNFPMRAFADLLPTLGEVEGRLYLFAELDQRAAPDAPPFTGLNGELGFALITSNIRSRILDVWGGRAISSLLRIFAGQKGSLLQCIAANAVLDDGVAAIRQFCIDTSSIRAQGTGAVDVPGQTIELLIRPRPKRTAIINLSTPLEVSGPIAHPDVRIQRGGLVRTTLRVYFWFLTMAEGIFQKQIPEHDFEAYMRLMQGEDP